MFIGTTFNDNSIFTINRNTLGKKIEVWKTKWIEFLQLKPKGTSYIDFILGFEGVICRACDQ